MRRHRDGREKMRERHKKRIPKKREGRERRRTTARVKRLSDSEESIH